MEKAICRIGVSTVYGSKFHVNSRVVCQVLFGDIVDILITEGKQFFIQTDDELYGWVLRSHFIEHIDSEHEYAITLDLFHPLVGKDNYFQIPMGSRLNRFDGINFKMNRENYTYNGQVYYPNVSKVNPELLVNISKRLLFTPFMFGGCSPMGIDSLSFVHLVYKILGISLPRNFGKLEKKGEFIDFVQQVQIGDLAFFKNKKGFISHVGIINSQFKVIHAMDMVREDWIDHYGLFIEKKNIYSHRLAFVKRILPQFPRSAIKLMGSVRDGTQQQTLF